jgi:hypothetical protein
VLRALATACLAVQGRGGDWDGVAKEHAALAGKVNTCKGRAAYTVLGALLDFHRRHPGTTVRPRTPSGGAPACAFRIVAVDTAEAQPGDTVGIEVRGMYFDPAELLRFGSVSIGGQPLPGPLVARSGSGDALVLSAVVPAPAACPRSVDVVVRYGTALARLTNAFTVTAPTAALPSPGPSQPASDDPGSGTPEGMFPFRPLPAHLPRP